MNMSLLPSTRSNVRLILSLGMIFFIALCVHLSEAKADSTNQPITVYVDTQEVKFDVDPYLKNGTTLVPVRALFEVMDLEVGWDPKQEIVTGTKDGLTITLKIGEKKATVNSETLPLLEAAEIKDRRTLVPLRFIGEATGAFVVWDPYDRSVNIVTPKFMEDNGITREDLERAIEEYFATREKDSPPATSKPTDPDDQDKTPAPGPVAPVDLANLEGMYYGLRADMGGYECGGICWDFYTFLPNNQVFIGLPANGGPETIDCKVEECLGYSIKDDSLKLSSGESLPIQIADSGHLMINKVKLDIVQAVPEGTTLDNDYKYIGYMGLIGIDVVATSWTYYLSLKSDGTFEMKDFSIGSVGATSDPSTHVSTVGDANTGTYEINGNTITMTASDGTVTQALFFIHNEQPKGSTDDIQIGSRNFYVEEE